jgi:integrase
VRHTHPSWLIDRGVDLARVQYRLGHGDLQATTRYVKILDEEAEGRGRHIGDTRRRCLNLECRLAVTHDAAPRKARLS